MTTDHQPPSSTGLQTVSEDGTAPKSRIDDFMAASGLVEQLRTANEGRNAKAAQIKGMFDGNPPFNPAKLRSAGMAYYPNFNTLEGKAYKASAKVPYYDLFSSAPQHIEVTHELGIGNEELEADASRVTTEELDRTVTDYWPAFDPTMGKLIDDFVAFGKGYLMWPDPVSWRFKRIAWHRVLVPDDTDVDLSEWEYFAVLRNFGVHELYNRIRDKETAIRGGWKPDAVLKAIRCASRTNDVSKEQDWMNVQRELRDHDLYVNNEPDRVATAFLFVKEFSGKWSQFVVPTAHYDSSGKKQDPDSGFLYKKVGLYDKIEHIIAPFFYDVEDGSVNGLSGLGKDIFAPMQNKDRMRCAQVNNVYMCSSILMQAKSGSGRQKAALAQIGNVCVIPEGYEVQQSTVLGDIESTLEVNTDLDRMLQSNTGIWRNTFEKPQGNPEPLGATRLRFTQGTVLTNSAVNRFHTQLDAAYKEVYRRIKKASDEGARMFRKWCEERGVTSNMLDKVRSVRSHRNIGNGSAFMRQDSLAGLLPMYGEFPEPGKQRFLSDMVSAYASAQKVELYLPKEARQNIPNRHVWEAGVENDSLSHGSPAQWTPEQDDIVHLASHAQAAQQALSSVGQGADPAGVAVFAQAVVSHAITGHIASLQNKASKDGQGITGRQKQVKQWLEVFTEIGGQAQELAKAVQKQAQQQAQLQQRQQQQLTDQQLDAEATAAKLQLKATEKQHSMGLKEIQTNQKLNINAALAAQKLEHNRANTSAKLLSDAAKLESSQRNGGDE